jgi:hypothetical protein
VTDKPIAGIDVAKGWLDICVDGGTRVERVTNTAEAVGAWLDRVARGWWRLSRPAAMSASWSRRCANAALRSFVSIPTTSSPFATVAASGRPSRKTSRSLKEHKKEALRGSIAASTEGCRAQIPSNCIDAQSCLCNSQASGRGGSGLLKGVEKGLRGFQIGRLEPFSEPVVDRL